MRIVLFIALAASTALAQDFEAAARHFGAAQDAFGKQHFHAAAAEFERAYEITKDPVLLYNIGEAWQKAGDGKKAVESYKLYVKANPTSQDRPDVQKRIRAIEKKKYLLPDQSLPDTQPVEVAAAAPAQPPAAGQTLTPDFDAPAASPAPVQAETTPAEPAAASPAPAVAEPAAAAPAEKKEASAGLLEDQPVSKLRVAAWICLAATVAVLAAGAIFALSAQARADEITRRLGFVDSTGQPRPFEAMAQSDFQSYKSDGQLYNNLGIGFFAGAGALAAVTITLFVVDYKRPAVKRAWNLQPSFGEKRAGLSLGWSF